MTLCVREFVSCEHHKESVVSGEIIYCGAVVYILGWTLVYFCRD